TKPTPDFAGFKLLAAARVLCQQSKLSGSMISRLHDTIIEEGEDEVGFLTLWGHRHMEQFCTNLETFDNFIIEKILSKALLRRPVEDLTPAYICGEALWFYDSDGKLTSRRLENEGAFRKRFRAAQKEAGVPEWAWIQPPQGVSEERAAQSSKAAGPR